MYNNVMQQTHQLPPVRVEEGLKNDVENFKERVNCDSESEAIRELLTRGLRQDAIIFASTLALGQIGKDRQEEVLDLIFEDDAISVPFTKAVFDTLGELTRNINLVDEIGSENMSKSEIEALYRIERGDAGLLDFSLLCNLLEDNEATKDALIDSVHSYSTDLEGRYSADDFKLGHGAES
jgi:hypothetical protein